MKNQNVGEIKFRWLEKVMGQQNTINYCSVPYCLAIESYIVTTAFNQSDSGNAGLKLSIAVPFVTVYCPNDEPTSGVAGTRIVSGDNDSESSSNTDDLYTKGLNFILLPGSVKNV
uniref:Uncharacterized protein n=1 Tax=Glossina austeni TaxID=7395 RepID=A0A1A9USL4_GLOAU